MITRVALGPARCSTAQWSASLERRLVPRAYKVVYRRAVSAYIV
jgi:hypothetical protein